MCRRGKNRVLGDLAASARRRGHRNVGHRRLADQLSAADDQIVQRVTAVSQQHCHRFADVQHASAADGHDDVCAVLLGRVGCGQATSMVGSPEIATTAVGSPSRSITS